MRAAALMLMTLVACGDDDGPSDPQIDGGPSDAGKDASGDAGDASADCSPLAQPYKFYTDGGLAPLRDVYTVSGSGTVKVERLPGGAYMDAGTYACTGALGACGTASLDVSDFTSALAGVSARWGDGETVFGDDHRPSDGQVLIVERTSDGKKIAIGNPCTSATGCTAIPTEVAQLQTLFARLHTDVTLGLQTDGGLAGSCSP